MTVCEWCDARLNGAGLCQHGCEKTPVFGGICIDCGGPFWTGRFSAEQCRPCEKRENARYVAAEAGQEIPRGYTADRIADKAARRTHANEKQDERSLDDAVDSGMTGESLTLERDR